jgi:hypothetical protein
LPASRPAGTDRQRLDHFGLKNPSTAQLHQYCPRRGWLPWSGKAVLPQVALADWFAGEREPLAPALVFGGRMIPLLRHAPDWVWLVPALPLLALSYQPPVLARPHPRRCGRATDRPPVRRWPHWAPAALLAIDLHALCDARLAIASSAHWFASGNWQGSFFLLDALSLSRWRRWLR